MKEKNINTCSTGTSPIIMLGLGVSMSFFPHNTSSEVVKEGLHYDGLIAMERKHNTPMHFSTDEYIQTVYTVNYTDAPPKYSNPNIALLSMAQNFANEQKALDKDFSDALDSLYKNKINSLPSKSRF